jgi:hypothetical protein
MVISYDIDLVIICYDLEIAVIWPIPSIQELEHRKFSPPEGEPHGTLIGLVTGVTAYLDRL